MAFMTFGLVKASFPDWHSEMEWGRWRIKDFFFSNSYFQNIQEVEKRGAAKSFSTNSGSRLNQQYQKEYTSFAKNFQTRGAYRQARPGTVMIGTSLTLELKQNMSQLLMLGKLEYGGGPIFEVVLEC